MNGQYDSINHTDNIKGILDTGVEQVKSCSVITKFIKGVAQGMVFTAEDFCLVIFPCISLNGTDAIDTFLNLGSKLGGFSPLSVIVILGTAHIPSGNNDIKNTCNGRKYHQPYTDPHQVNRGKGNVKNRINHSGQIICIQRF